MSADLANDISQKDDFCQAGQVELYSILNVLQK